MADKIGVLWEMIERADKVLVGGRMAFTFLAAKGVSVGRTSIETAWLERAAKMIQYAADKVRARAQFEALCHDVWILVFVLLRAEGYDHKASGRIYYRLGHIRYSQPSPSVRAPIRHGCIQAPLHTVAPVKFGKR